MTSNQDRSVDAVVVGGGLAGLAAATYLARGGKSVIVLERSSHIGGRAITEDRGGFKLNLGPHALYKSGAGVEILKDLGVDFTADEPPQSGLALLEGRLQLLPGGPVSMLKSKLFSVSEKLEFGKLFATVGLINTDKLTGMTLNQWIAKNVRRPKVQDAVRALVRVATYTNDPDRMTASHAIGQVQMALKGVLYLDGGWQTLVDGLAARATEAGVTIETSAVVTALADRGATKVVQCGDDAYEARTVILATPPKVASELVGPAGAELLYQYEAAGPVRAATLDVGLSETPNPDGRFVLGIDVPLYLSIHSGITKLAPEGGAMIHVAKYLGDDNSEAKHVERELEALLDLAQPGWRDVCLEKRFLPNLNVVNMAAIVEQGGLPGRPSVATDIDGVFLAGDWVGPEGWLVDGSLASAKAAAEAALAVPASPAEPIAVGAR